MPPRRNAISPAVTGNHNRWWIGGRHVVLESLRAGRWIPLEVACARDGESPEFREARELARTLGIPVQSLTTGELTRLCRADDHQGLAMRLPEYPYYKLTDLLDSARRPAALLILDRVQDSHNFGAILRSAEVFGFDGVLVGTREQSPVNSQTVRSSSGAVHHLTLARVEDLLEAARQIRGAGIQLVGTSPTARVTVSQTDFSVPTALVLGNEGLGVSPALAELCDLQIRIPQQGQVGSLNASVSAGVLCYELRRQRGTSRAGG